jgi:Rieske Fe-S protein
MKRELSKESQQIKSQSWKYLLIQPEHLPIPNIKVDSKEIRFRQFHCKCHSSQFDFCQKHFFF